MLVPQHNVTAARIAAMASSLQTTRRRQLPPLPLPLPATTFQRQEHHQQLRRRRQHKRKKHKPTDEQQHSPSQGHEADSQPRACTVLNEFHILRQTHRHMQTLQEFLLWSSGFCTEVRVYYHLQAPDIEGKHNALWLRSVVSVVMSVTSFYLWHRSPL